MYLNKEQLLENLRWTLNRIEYIESLNNEKVSYIFSKVRYNRFMKDTFSESIFIGLFYGFTGWLVLLITAFAWRPFGEFYLYDVYGFFKNYGEPGIFHWVFSFILFPYFVSSLIIAIFNYLFKKTRFDIEKKNIERMSIDLENEAKIKDLEQSIISLHNELVQHSVLSKADLEDYYYPISMVKDMIKGLELCYANNFNEALLFHKRESYERGKEYDRREYDEALFNKYLEEQEYTRQEQRELAEAQIREMERVADELARAARKNNNDYF